MEERKRLSGAGISYSIHDDIGRRGTDMLFLSSCGMNDSDEVNWRRHVGRVVLIPRPRRYMKMEFEFGRQLEKSAEEKNVSLSWE